MKMVQVLVFAIIMVLLAACFPLTVQQPKADFPSGELPVIAISGGQSATPMSAAGQEDLIPVEELSTEVTWEQATLPDTYWITNPSSGAKLFVQVTHPSYWNGSALPALVLIPGGVGWGGNFIGPHKEAEALAGRGFTVVVFDPEGRGRSAGEENWDGYIHQDGLMTVVQFARLLPEVQPQNIGLVSFSYGVTMATGFLARYPDNGIIFYIDWEGPVTRYDTTTSPQGECNVEESKQDWQPCENEDWWVEREALTFMTQALVPAYQRVQSEQDHVQPDVTHAIQIVNQAVETGIGWVRLNDLPLNQTYDEKDPPQMLAEDLDRIKSKVIGDYAEELLELFGK